MARRRALSHEGKIYYEFSHLYERIFTNVLGPRICSTVRLLGIEPGAKVLEVGVGTGLSLEAYPPHADVTAIDLAPEMLAQAQEKVDENGWSHINLLRMDAQQMDFADEQFDYVLAFHIVSVVPEPDRLIREMIRVTKTGGTIVIINHFRSEKKWLAPLVDMLDPMTRRIGWRTTLRFDQVLNGYPLNVKQRFKTSRGSLFTVVVATKTEASGLTTVDTPKVCSKPPWDTRAAKKKRPVVVAREVQSWAAGLAHRGLRKPRKNSRRINQATKHPD